MGWLRQKESNILKPKLSFEDLIDRLTNEKGITLGTFQKSKLKNI